MAQTYVQLQQQIATLQARAEAIKQSERSTTIAKVKAIIADFALTPQDLFGAKGPKAAKPAKAKKARSAEAKYRDGNGNVWVGRGKRPQWLSTALRAGAKLEDFAASNVSAAPALPEGAAAPAATAEATTTPPAKTAKRAAKKKAAAKRGASKAKYQDGAGNSWSGMGPKPKWLKAAIAGGKKLEDFSS